MPDQINLPSGFTLVPPQAAPKLPPGFTLVQPDAAPAGPAKPQMSRLERFGTGLNDPIVGAAQLTAHLLPGTFSEKADRYVREREKDIEETSPKGSDFYRTAGSALNPMSWAPALIGGPVAGGVLSGATSAALEPVTDKDYWKTKAKETGIGAVTGAATGAAGKAIGGAIAPVFRSDAQKLLDAGVDLTPGQMGGHLTKHLEEAGKSIPIAGTAVRGAELRTIDSFNRATVNQALAPIGEKVSADASGRPMIAEASDKLDKAYDNLLPQMTFHADQQFMQDATAVEVKVQSMALPDKERAQWNQIVSQRFLGRLDPSDKMDGKTLKQVESELTRFANNYKGSTDAAQRDLGHAVGELRTVIRDTLERQDPTHTTELAKINTAYAMLARVENAASARPTASGRFTPGDLLSAVKSADKSVRHRAFARGDALLQEWAQSGQNVIGNTLPDSGTAGRMMADALMVGGAAYEDPRLAATMVGLGLPYTKPATAALNYWARDPSALRQGVSSVVRKMAPGTAPFTSDELLSLLGIAPGQSNEKTR